MTVKLLNVRRVILQLMLDKIEIKFVVLSEWLRVLNSETRNPHYCTIFQYMT